MRSTLLHLLCIAILGGILVAGLWPFDAPMNRVHWLPDRAGLWFGRHGTVLSTREFRANGGPGDESCAIEMYLAPATAWDHRAILAFYAGNGVIPLSLRQSNGELLIERGGRGAEAQKVAAKLYVGGVFRRGRGVLITITSDGRRTAVYADGALAAQSREFAFNRGDLRGKLIIANSPLVDDSWSGLLRGVALYGKFLTPPQVLQDDRSWTERGRPFPRGDAATLALYVFDGTAGNIIHNEAGPGPDLFIPRQYTVVDQTFLERPWDEFQPSLKYVKDVLINIGGFIPLGFVFYPYFSLIRRRRDAALITILFGAAVSVAIEVLQAYLPTRDSGMTDIITNTVGTALGAGLCGGARFAFEGLVRSRHRQVRAFAAWVIDGDSLTGGADPARGALG